MTRSSDSNYGFTIRRMRGQVIDIRSQAQHWWNRCGGGDCVEAFWAGRCVNVRDTKLYPASPVQRWTSELWGELLDAVRAGGPLAVGMDSPYPTPAVEVVDELVLLNGDPRHQETLSFTLEEWNAFVVGVLAKAYEPDRLRSFAGVAVCGSGEIVELLPVAADSDSPAGRVDAETREGASTGEVVQTFAAGQPGSLLPYRICGPHCIDGHCCDTDSPAGRLDEDPAPPLGSPSIVSNPTAGQPGATNDGSLIWTEDTKLGEAQAPGKANVPHGQNPEVCGDCDCCWEPDCRHGCERPGCPCSSEAATAGQGPGFADRSEAGAGDSPSPGSSAPAAAPVLDEWQREDGFPRDEYFDAVVEALGELGIDFEDWRRDEDWEFNLGIARASYADGPMGWAKYGLWISWRTNEEDEPKHADDFSGLGWYWVPYSKSSQEALGDFAREFDGLAYLAEPADVAAAVADLIGVRQAAAPLVPTDGAS